MTDSVVFDGVSYISTKKAASIAGYTQDYVGQLLRKGQIEGKRIGSHWYVLEDSLNKHKTQADLYVPVPPGVYPSERPHSVVSFDGNEYISASRASQETGYNHDYVTQLARSGKILSRQIGNRWFLQKNALLQHKKEKDSMLAAVQASSVGLVRSDLSNVADDQITEKSGIQDVSTRYFQEQAPLIPVISAPEQPVLTLLPETEQKPEPVLKPVPIRKIVQPQIKSPPNSSVKKARKSNVYLNISSYALTVMLLLSLGMYTFKDQASFAQNNNPSNVQTANAASAFAGVVHMLELMVTKEVVFQRGVDLN